MQPSRSLVATLWAQGRGRILLLGLLLLTVLSAAVLLHWVLNPQLEKLTHEKIQLQQQLRERRIEFANSGVPVSIAERLKYDLEQFQALIPPRENFTVFLKELFQWAELSGLVIDQVNYQPKIDDKSGLLTYGLNFAVTGHYSQIKQFIHALEISERILIINSLSLAGGNNRLTGEAVTLRIDLTTYFQGTQP